MHCVRGTVRIYTGFDIWLVDTQSNNFDSSIINIQFTNGQKTKYMDFHATFQ